MKKIRVLTLSFCVIATHAYAGTPGLPPVLDNSTYNNPAVINPTVTNNPVIPTNQSISTPNNQDLPTVPVLDTSDNPAPINTSFPTTESSGSDSLKNELSELKNKMQAQERAINDLKNANAELQKKLADLDKSSVPSAIVKPHAQTETIANKVPSLTPTAVVISTSTSNNGASEKQRYQNASELLKKGDYTQAISEFQSLIKTYPNGNYADNSQYWIGVALMNKGDKEASMRAFDKLTHNYPKSEKIPDTLYKLGSVLLSVNNKTKAKEYFNYLVTNYPNTGAAVLAKKARIGL